MYTGKFRSFNNKMYQILLIFRLFSKKLDIVSGSANNSNATADVLSDFQSKLYIPSTLNIDLTIDCVCSKMLNLGLNHGLFLSLFKFFWMEIHSKLKNAELKKPQIAMLLQISGFYLKYKLFCQKPAHSYLPKWLC